MRVMLRVACFLALTLLSRALPLRDIEALPEQRWIYRPHNGRSLDPATLGVRDCYFGGRGVYQRLQAFWSDCRLFPE